jgi:SAM-dependent methyltransferase
LKVHFCTFGNTSAFRLSRQRIVLEASKSNFFDSVVSFDETDLPLDLLSYAKSNNIGFGHWIWKPYIIYKRLVEIPEGDVLVYADAGSSINAGANRVFQSYLLALSKSNSDLLAFEMRDNNVIPIANRHWIKGDLIRHFNAESLLDAPHLCAGVILMKKNNQTADFAKLWYNIAASNPEFLTIGPSVGGPDYSGFKRNHSVQAIFSLLCRHFTTVYNSASEILPELHGGDLSKMSNFPIIKTRISDIMLTQLPLESMRDSLSKPDKNFITNVLALTAQQTMRGITGNFNFQLHDIANQLADVRQLLMRERCGVNPLDLLTDYPIAVNSNDHIQPRGSRKDNTRSLRFCNACERHFQRLPLSFLDLGCAGGGLVFDFLVRGHLAMGLEGSDYSLKNQRAEWRTIPEYLKTCDIVKPFRLEDRKTRQLKHFDIISMWEVLEHIHQDDLPTLFSNIRNHLKDDGLFLGSIALRHDTVDGIDYHKTVMPQQWWVDAFTQHGLSIMYEHNFAFNDFCRGTGNGPEDSDFSKDPGAGFHFVAKLISTSK